MTLNWDSIFYLYAIFNISLSPALSLNGPHKNNLFVPNSCNVSQPLPCPNTSPRTDLPSASYPSLMAVEALLMLSPKLGAWPNAILAAENDAGTRSVVSKVKGWPIDGTLWTLDKNGAQTFYAQDVWSLIDHHCLLIRQFLSLLPEDSVIFFAAGSPCPDLTIIGRGQGLLGLAGDRSVLIHRVWAVVYYLSFTPFWKRLVILVENAPRCQMEPNAITDGISA